MFLKAFNMVSVWDSNLLADSNPPRRINHQPFRIPRSLMIIWPLRWLPVGLQAPFHHPLYPTFGVILKKVNPASGTLLWTCHLPMGVVLTMVMIRANFPCTTFTWTRSLTWLQSKVLGLLWLNSMWRLHIAILQFTQMIVISWGWSGVASFLWTWPSHLASTLHLIFLIQWLIWWSG